jgi:DNA-binding beta-propeller fold protein YncE
MKILLLLLIAGCVEPEPIAPPDPTPVDEGGPGLGNVAWDVDSLFEPVGWVNNDNGVPPADTPALAIKPYGTNVASMHSGYLFTLFAPDSGWAPGGLLFYDVSDPTDVQLVHRVFEPEGRTKDFREAHSMGFSDFDGRRHVVFHSGTGVEFWDLSDPMAPEQLSVLDLPGVAHGDYEFVSWQLAWQGPYVYVSSSERGVFVVDASDPLNPVLAERGFDRPNPVPPGELGGFRVGPIFAVGNLLILSSMDTEGGYSVSDISDPANPALLSAATVGFEKFYSTCFGGNRIVGSVRGSGAAMTIHDITDPFVLDPVVQGPVIDNQLYCSMQDEFVFQGNEDDLTKVDVSDPTAPVVVGSGSLGIEHADHGQVLPFGNLIWVGNDHGSGSAFVPHQLEPDERGPAVTMVSPSDGALSQAVTSRIGFTFSDSVLLESLDASSIRVLDAAGDAVSGRLAAWASTVNFAPDQPLETATTYTVEVDGVRDFAGNAMEAPHTSTFTTSLVAPGDFDEPLRVTIDTTEPVLVGSSVELSATVTGADDVELTWSLGGVWSEVSTANTIDGQFDEPGHVSVIVRATDGARVATHAISLTVHRPIVGAASRSSTLAFGDDRLWVVNPDQDTVTAIQLSTLEVFGEYPACATPKSVAVTDQWLLVTCLDELLLMDPLTGQVWDRLQLGHGARAWGVVAGEDIWTTHEGTGELVQWDADGTELARIPLGPSAQGMALSADGGTVYVSRFVSPDEEGMVWAVDTETMDVEVIPLARDETTVDAEDRARGLPNYLGAPSISPDGTAMWVPSKTDNILRGLVRDGQELDHESSVRAVASIVSLPDGVEDVEGRLDFNDRALPSDVAFTPLGDYALVALMASNGVEIRDAYSGASVGALASPGAAPRSVLISPDGTRAYVHAWLSRSVSVYDLTEVLANRSYGPPRIANVSVVETESLSDEQLAGKRVFTNARDARMSRDGYISCAVCHLDGAHDGRTWDFTDRGEGLRNTHDLRGRSGMGHGPLHWTANFDEVQDFENDIRGPFGGAGFLDQALWDEGTRSDPLGDPKAGLSTELDALAAYVSSLTGAAPSPWRPGEFNTVDGEAGELLFADLACTDCHAGGTFTDSGTELYDVGTITPDSGQRRGEELTGFDPPTLRGVHASPPYLHDGSAATLMDVLTTRNPTDLHGATSPLTAEALDQLVAYLRELE